jgi:hypothetical protein
MDPDQQHRVIAALLDSLKAANKANEELLARIAAADPPAAPPAVVGKKRKERKEGKVGKKRMTPYNFYVKERFGHVQVQEGEKRMSVVGKEWSRMSPEQKAPYVEAAAKTET